MVLVFARKTDQGGVRSEWFDWGAYKCYVVGPILECKTGPQS